MKTDNTAQLFYYTQLDLQDQRRIRREKENSLSDLQKKILPSDHDIMNLVNLEGELENLELLIKELENDIVVYQPQLLELLKSKGAEPGHKQEFDLNNDNHFDLWYDSDQIVHASDSISSHS